MVIDEIRQAGKNPEVYVKNFALPAPEGYCQCGCGEKTNIKSIKFGRYWKDVSAN